MLAQFAAGQSRTRPAPGGSHEFFSGFLAMLPLWTGAIPFGITYAVAAREIGIGALETQLMSLTVFAAAAQISMVSLWQAGASDAEVIIAAIALNIHVPLIGAAIAAELRVTRASRAVIAWFMSDATYAVAVSQGRLRTPVLLGAGVCMYIGWNLGTAIGVTFGALIENPAELAIDFVVPLTFIAVLVPIIRDKPALVIVLSSSVAAIAIGAFIPTGFAVLLIGAAGGVIGSTFGRAEKQDRVR